MREKEPRVRKTIMSPDVFWGRVEGIEALTYTPEGSRLLTVHPALSIEKMFAPLILLEPEKRSALANSYFPVGAEDVGRTVIEKVEDYISKAKIAKQTKKRFLGLDIKTSRFIQKLGLTHTHFSNIDQRVYDLIGTIFGLMINAEAIQYKVILFYLFNQLQVNSATLNEIISITPWNAKKLTDLAVQLITERRSLSGDEFGFVNKMRNFNGFQYLHDHSAYYQSQHNKD